MERIIIRPAAADDEEFLFDLYCAVRQDEFLHLPLPEEQRARLIRQQYDWQNASYHANHPDSGYQIVMIGNQPEGRLWVAKSGHPWTLVDVAVHPRMQKRGVATELLSRLQLEATEAGASISSSVFRFNVASLKLHQRLNFQVTAQDAMQLHFLWSPQNDSAQ